MKKEKTITIEIDGIKKDVPKSSYVIAKTKQLKEFGYPSLTEEEVTKALDLVLEGKTKGVIAMFIESDLPKHNSCKKEI